MSTQIQDIEGVLVNRYARELGKGSGFQVTWLSESTHTHVWVSFDNEDDALRFAALIRSSIKR